jgi:hypothetical protein
MTRSRMALVLGVLLALALAVAACGGGKTSGVASLGGDKATGTTRAGGGQDERQAALNYARCMRQHGINMPDPKFDAQGHSSMQNPPGVGPGNPKYDAAEQTCQQYLPGGGAPEKPNPQEQQQMVQFARCMRQHGVDIPDPKPGGGIDLDASKGANPDSPKFKAAERACQQYEPKGGKSTQSNGGGQ